MEETPAVDSIDIHIEALKALISPGVYAAALEDSPLIDLPAVVKRVGLGSAPGVRARGFIDVLERVVAEQLKMNDRKAAEMLFALGEWTGKPAQERRVAVAKLRDKHWTWEKNYRKEPLHLDLRKVYLALSREVDTLKAVGPVRTPSNRFTKFSQLRNRTIGTWTRLFDGRARGSSGCRTRTAASHPTTRDP